MKYPEPYRTDIRKSNQEELAHVEHMEFMAVRVYQRVDIKDPNTMRFLGWLMLDVGTVKFLYDPNEL